VYTALKGEKGAGEELLEKKTQASLVYRACRTVRTFAEVLAEVSKNLKGKKKATIEANSRWYLADLKKKGLERAVPEKTKEAPKARPAKKAKPEPKEEKALAKNHRHGGDRRRTRRERIDHMSTCSIGSLVDSGAQRGER
jgi:hypothetical protein